MSNANPVGVAGGARLHAFDAARAIALLLGVVLHATMSFLPPPVVWLVGDTDRSVVLGLVFYLIHMSRMVVFFWLAGFFARLSFHRLGARVFLKDRATRIGLPLVVGWPLLMAAYVLAWLLGVLIANGGQLPPRPSPGVPAAAEFPWAHLWFLYLLLVFYAAALCVRAGASWLDRQGRAGWLSAGVDALVRRRLQDRLPLLLALPLALCLYLDADWVMWGGIRAPDRGFLPNLPALVGYGGMFALGWAMHRQPGLLHSWQRRWPQHLLVAVGATVVCLHIIGLNPVLEPAPPGVEKLLYALCYSVGAVSWTFALLGLALRFLSGHSERWRYLADASYWIYLVHLPLLIALQALVSRLELPWGVKFPLILGVAFPLLLLSYAKLVRGTAIGMILNGGRKSTQGNDQAMQLPGRQVPG